VIGRDHQQGVRPFALKSQTNLERLVERDHIVKSARGIAVVAAMIDTAAFDLKYEMGVAP
jgi:hypothetical protein